MLKIIRAESNDASLLKEIAIQSKGWWGYTDHLMAQFAQAPIITLESIHTDLVFKASLDQVITGWYRLIANTPISELEDLWVLPAYIGKGIGRALFQHMLDQAKALSNSAIEFDADPNAAAFYEHMGCTIIGQTMSEWKRYIPRMRYAF